MAGKSSDERLNLERQNAAIMAVFERAGFDYIAPDIIQPADIFLERSGEDIRARTFVFNDPLGQEMCLRPDLTVPTCRYHLSHVSDVAAEARYCYAGPAFRFPDEHLSPQEFNQAGVEWFGSPEAAAAEARVLKLTLSALEAAGLTRYSVTLGDLSLFSALLKDTAMPERWRQRLRHQFWRPQAFRDVLEGFTSSRMVKRSSISVLVDQVEQHPALEVVEKTLAARHLTLVGGRSPEDIAQRLEDKAADRSETLLSREVAQMLLDYLEIETSADKVPPLAHQLLQGFNLVEALTHYEQRLEAMEELGLNPRRFTFKATFGRELEYYTGFVFQVDVETEAGPVTVAGGGRYDQLLSDMGAPEPVSAVGCAIHTERLMAVLA